MKRFVEGVDRGQRTSAPLRETEPLGDSSDKTREVPLIIKDKQATQYTCHD